jgi:DNA-binding MarR family transcriptional regulator
MSKQVHIPSCNCLALRQATRAISAFYDRYLAPSGVTTAQYSILMAIHEQPGVGMQDLSEQLVMDRTNLLRAVQPLTRDGYIEQRSDPQNARRLLLSLTAEGRAKYQQSHAYWSEAQAEFESGVGTSRAAELREQLANLASNRSSIG